MKKNKLKDELNIKIEDKTEKLFEIILQGSLEYNGVSYIPGDVVSVPENIYDMLISSYLNKREKGININDN